jgi:glucokinase
MDTLNRPYLAIDFGGTKNSCAAFLPDERGAYRLDTVERHASPRDRDAEYDYATMLDLARKVLGGRTPEAVGVSFGGPVRASEGLVVLSHHVAGWENAPLRARLENEFQTRVVMDNDANVAALGETRFGAGKNCSSVLYITVSTGVGGGWVLDGDIYRGANELAGEIGHVVIDPAGPLCVCGRRGCVEQLACGPAIARIAREGLVRAPERGKILRALIENDLSQLTALRVNQAALAGDDLATKVMSDAASALGFALGNVICLMNPRRILIGGGVSKAGSYFFETIRAAARANVMPQLRDAVDILPAALGDDAPLWGALALVTKINKEVV